MSETDRLISYDREQATINHDVDSEEPADRFYFNWIVCCLLGVGTLFPWNAFLTAFSYFNGLWGSILPVEFYLGIVYNWPNITFLLLSVKWGPLVPLRGRVYASFWLFFACLALVMPVCIVLPREISLACVFLLVALAGVGSAVSFGSVLGLTASFPASYTTAVMIGNGIAGIIVGMLQMFTTAVFPSTERGLEYASALYFALGAMVILACIVGFFFQLRTPYARYHLEKRESASRALLQAKSANTSGLAADWRVVLYKVWQEAYMVCAVFFVTLALFPGMTLEFHNSSSWMTDNWFGIVMIFLFQLFDFVGRSLPRLFIAFNTKTLWVPVMGRFAFFAIFILCVRLKFLQHNWISFLAQTLFAVSNGYLGTLCMMFGPEHVDTHEKETAGIIMSFMLNLGILGGAIYAFLVGYVAAGVSPLGGG